jgi:hypothetical protein
VPDNLTEIVITRRHRVPLPDPVEGDGAAVARQLDAALLSAGFMCSRELLTDLGGREAGQVLDIGVTVLRAARRLAGDHVQHNPYFRDFPFNVPATLEFWAGLIEKARAEGAPKAPSYVVTSTGEVAAALNLLTLPGYGKVQHTYEDMLAARDELAASAGDRITVLHKGGSPRAETERLYLELAGSAVPLPEEDRALLAELAAECVDGPRPGLIPVRENRAIVNRAALAAGRALLADTVTDVLRLAADVSGGDVTLEQPSRFRSFSRRERRVLMACLDDVVRDSPAKLGDVARHAEAWKRLGERLHPHEYGGQLAARRVFAVARGEERMPSLAARTEGHFRSGAPEQAARVLSSAPGLLIRSLDRLLRAEGPPEQARNVLSVAAEAAPQAACRVLLSAREHFGNRGKLELTGLPRIFANRAGRGWVAPEARPALDPGIRGEALVMLDEAIAARLPAGGRLIVDPAVLGVALPLAGKPAAPGIGVLPRGSVSSVVPASQDVLSFFVYWRQRAHRTDYDLSALIATTDFSRTDFVSWQAYQSADAGVTYSGDITDAPDGATEFISADLERLSLPVIIPQVNIYSGEGFDEAAEAFFGYMLRGAAQRGAPFEAATVRMKSDLRGVGRVALPLAFIRGEEGQWRAKWLHFYLKGRASMNVVQGHRMSAGLLARTVIEREYLQIRYLAALWGPRTADGHVIEAAGPQELAAAVADTPGPVTYIGLERPEGLAADAMVYTLENLSSLIPA